MESGNGNSHAATTSLSKQTHRIEESPSPAAAAQVMELPPWLKTLRDAMGNSMKGEDLTQIMGAQLEKAKAGDVGAAKFVFDQAHKLIQSEQRRVTITQNNYYD